ncbi:glycosyltransferase family 4 protein [Actinomycetota bacterium Odt1-20B]
MHIALTGPVDLAPLRDAIGGSPPPVLRGPSTGHLARLWWRRGHQVTVVALSDAVTERCAYDSGNGLRLVVVPQRSAGRARDLFRHERRQLAAALRDERADVISAHWTYEFALGAIASGRPAFVTARDTPLRYAWEMRSAYRWARHSLAVPAVHRATALSANSPYTAAHLRRCLGALRPIEMIPNGVDLTALPNPAARTGGPVFAAALQGWGPLKNTTSLLRAFALVRRQVPEARLLLIGTDHEEGGPAHAWARTHGLDEAVEFVGRLPHAAALARLSAEAYALVHPSRVESFSMICAEAMALGLPVVAGRRSGAVPWVVGEAGLLTDIDRPERIARAMVLLARDEGLAVRLGAAGRRRVSAHFSLEATAGAYLDWFARHA